MLASVFFMMTSMNKNGETISAAPAAPNLFPFIKTMEAVSADNAATREHANADASKIPVDAQQALRAPDTATFMPTHVASVEASILAMRKHGASDDEVYRQRAIALSAQAAAQLADMEREEAAWRVRIDAYLAERNRLLSDAANSPRVDGVDALRQLRDARFTFEEQERLTAHELFDAPRLILP